MNEKINLNDLYFDTPEGRKTLASCSDEEFVQFLKNHDIEVLDGADSTWTIHQREMAITTVCNYITANIIYSEENQPEESE